MKPSTVRGWKGIVMMTGASALLACGDSPSSPGDGINPGLLESSGDPGIASAVTGDLPQGAASFTGPGGMAMDATAEEFIQRVTLPDGTVLRTSGLYVKAVPDELVVDPPFDQLSFGSAFTGSLESVPPGTYSVDAVWPEFDFIREVKVTYARIRETGTRNDYRADGGVVTITSVNYFDDVYPCELNGDVFTVERCDYQIGLIQGEVDFNVPLDGGGQVVQQHESFAVPIRRETIYAQLNR